VKKVVFTNGCFDLIHPGHIDLLRKARELGDYLIVGINSDQSIRNIKGLGRPILSQEDRIKVLSSINYVDEVRVFDEPTPEKLINEIKPDVLVKGGDWPIPQIIGGTYVLSYGGKVLSIPLTPGYSSTNIIDIIKKDNKDDIELKKARIDSINEHFEILKKFMDDFYIYKLFKIAGIIKSCFDTGGKLLLCGNGGSAADCQHIAAEFVVRFEKERKGLPAIALTTDTSVLTASNNDYGNYSIFTRQVEALADEKDVLLAISTSGSSDNVINAVMLARDIGCKTIGLTGENGKKLASVCDESILVPSSRTARIQEIHIMIGHIICELVEGDK
jgi:D-sedoheptulose 7-phosphate isomerase